MDAVTTMFSEMKAQVESVMKQNDALKKRVMEMETERSAAGRFASPDSRAIIPMMTWVLHNVRPEGDAVAAMMLRILITNTPELFEVYGTLHTDPAGNKTYYTVRMWHDDSKKIFNNIHIYVTLRHGKTHINCIEVYHFAAVSRMVYTRRGPKSEGSPRSVDGSID